MRKFFALLAMSVCILGAEAQKTVQGCGFLDEWSVGLVSGASTPVAHSAFWKNMRPTYGIEMTKRIIPEFSMGFQLLTAHNVAESSTVFDETNLSLTGAINLSNLFAAYYGKPRKFELEAVASVGWGHHFYNTSKGDDYNFMSSKFGLNLNFYVTDNRAWYVGIKPSIVYNMDNGHTMPTYNVNRSRFELLAGITYHFKNTNNRKHHFTLQRAYDPTEVDALQAKINGLYAMVEESARAMGKKDSVITVSNEKVKALQEELNRYRECSLPRDANTPKALESVVSFRQGSCQIEMSQIPNIERIVSMLKKHKSSMVKLRGYASPEGKENTNQQMSHLRAEAVKRILIQRYGIEAKRIMTEGVGVGNLFSDPGWNRVCICTLYNI